MRDMKKKLPEFKNEDDERKFWATADSTEYVDWRSGKRKKLVRLGALNVLATRHQGPNPS